MRYRGAGRPGEGCPLAVHELRFALHRMERQALRSPLTRRQFAIGSAAIASGALVGGLIGRSLAQGESVHFNTPLPIPPLIDADRQVNAVKFKVTSGRHAFIKASRRGLTATHARSWSSHPPALRRRRSRMRSTSTPQCTRMDFCCPEMSTVGRIRLSSQAVHGVRDSKSISRLQPCGFILICTMTRRDRSIWASQD